MSEFRAPKLAMEVGAVGMIGAAFSVTSGVYRSPASVAVADTPDTVAYVSGGMLCTFVACLRSRPAMTSVQVAQSSMGAVVRVQGELACAPIWMLVAPVAWMWL